MRLAFVLLAACESGATYVPSPVPGFITRTLEQGDLIAVVANAARSHRAWPRIDNVLRAAPIPCAAGDMAGTPPASEAPLVSAASDGPHGRKLFYLRTQQPEVYAGDEPVPVGFAIVKEAFAAIEVPPPPAHCYERNGQYCMQRGDTVHVDGKRLRAGDSTGLFVMAKVGPSAVTDQQWIYGTVSEEGRVMEAGRVPSCMACHEDAAHERLFGVL